MNTEQNPDSTIDDAAKASRRKARRAQKLAVGAMERWDAGETPDARALIELHPELRDQHSIVLELAYDEYCRREEGGEKLSTSQFCDRFSWIRASVERMIEVHNGFGVEDFSIDDLPAEKKVPWPEPGETLDDFEIIAPLGRGGFARVFVAKQLELDRLVTIKVSNAPSSEARIIARLAHANVVPVLSTHRDDEQELSLLCMPYLGGATLEDALNSRAEMAGHSPPAGWLRQVVDRRNAELPPVRMADDRVWPAERTYIDGVVTVIAQLAEALSVAHGDGVVHRDIKPSNVLLAPNGRPMLLDFNLSTESNETVTKIGGTVGYMSPEQLLALAGESKAGCLTPAVDIYSLGLVTYQLLTGRLPFEYHNADSLSEVISLRNATHDRGIESPRSVNGEIAESLSQIVLQCLASDPAKRPTAKVLAELLRETLAPPLQLQTQSIEKPSTVRKRRHVASIAGLAAMLIVGLTTWTIVRSPADSVAAATSPHDAANDVVALTTALEIAKQEEAVKAEVVAHMKAAEGLVRKQQYHEAISELKSAQLLDPKNPQVMNNLAYCFLKTFTNLQEAKHLLSQAISIEPKLGAAYHNRALLDLMEAYKDPADQPTSGLNDIKVAMPLCAPSGELYRDAAQLHALTANGDSRQISEGIKCMQRALELGMPMATLEEDNPYFSALKASPDFANLSKIVSTANARTFNAKRFVSVP